MPKVLIKPQVDESKAFLRLYKNALENTIVTSRADPYRLLNIRCSQLPFCPLAFFVNVSKNGLHQHLDVLGMYYTSVGTTVHTVMQKAMTIDNESILGNWKCPHCGSTALMTTVKQCCGFPMDYEEITINYKGIKGHIDGVYKSASGLWIVDYKTASLANVMAKTKDPGPAYKEQLYSYATLFDRQWGKQLNLGEVKGVLNLFIPRDDPKQAVTWSMVTPASKKDAQFEKLMQYKKMLKTVLAVSSKSEVKDLLDFDKCSDPYCKVCANWNTPAKKILLDAYRLAKQRDQLPLKSFIQSKMK